MNVANASPRGSEQVFMVRHGETESNRSHRYAGRNDDCLTPEGRRQILNLAGPLAGENIAAIWTSPIVRAGESAGLLSQELGIPLKEDSRLAEMLLGPWEGLTENEVAQQYPLEYHLWNTMPNCVEMSGRETLRELATRVMAAVDDACRHKRPVLLMTHVAPIRVAALQVLELDLNWYKSLSVPNATCFRVDRRGGEIYRVPGMEPVRNELRQTSAAEMRHPC